MRPSSLRYSAVVIGWALALVAGCNLLLGNSSGELAPGGVLGGDAGSGDGGVGDSVPGTDGKTGNLDSTCCGSDAMGGDARADGVDDGCAQSCGPGDACMGGSCDAGDACTGPSCNPPPPCDGGACNAVAIATGQSVPFDLAVDGTTVYFTNAGNDGGTGSVAAVAIAGGGVTTYAQGLKGVGDIAIDTSNIYWLSHDATQATNGRGDIATVAKTGGTPAFVIQGLDDDLRRLAIYGGNFFWSLDFFGDIFEKVSNQVNPVELTTNMDLIGGMQVDSTGIYAASGGSNAGGYPAVVVNVLFDGGGTTLYDYGTTQSLAGLAIDAANVYYTNASDNTVDQVPKSGNPVPPPIVIAQAQNNPSRVAVDSAFVYWTTEGTAGASYRDGTVMKALIGGGQTIQLAGAQHRPRGIAVDDTNVYWTNMGDGTVMKRPKS